MEAYCGSTTSNLQEHWDWHKTQEQSAKLHLKAEPDKKRQVIFWHAHSLKLARQHPLRKQHSGAGQTVTQLNVDRTTVGCGSLLKFLEAGYEFPSTTQNYQARRRQ